MAPVEERCADALPLLEDERADAALDEMRRCGKPDGTCTPAAKEAAA